jgi:hypothetical protein
MTRSIAFFALTGMLVLSSCAKQETEAPNSGAETPAASQPQPAGGPHVIVHLKDGSKVLGTIVASSQTDMVVAGDNGIESKIPTAQVKSVEYGEAQPAQPALKASREPAPPKTPEKEKPAPPQQQTAQQTAQPLALTPPPPPAVTTRTYELPAGSEISVRTNETIDSGTAAEGQTFDAEVTRDARDVDGDVVIPRGCTARLVIRSASKGGRFRGTSDLVLDLQSVTINGRQYTVDVADISQKGKSGVGANRRTAEYAGGGAALGAIIGAIAGGGKGAAIGAGAGAGAGVLTQVLTKGGAIKVPVESVLTFKLDKPLKVIAVQ